MTWRIHKCPLYASQDGVCGCREYWERKNSRAELKDSTTDASSTRLRSPSSTPPGPPREICFFWYHGTCRRGAECKLAHESHITWPMTPPPGFVHFEPCDLPLCPLRQDLVAFKDKQKRRECASQMGGRLDGATMSYLSRDTPVTTSSDDSSTLTSVATRHEDEELGSVMSTSIIDPNSKPLNGFYPDTSDSESGSDGEEGAHEVNAEPRHNNPHIHGASTVSSSTHLPSGMDYFDLSGYAPLPPSSHTEEDPILSLSHTGTLGKRKRNTSPDGTNNGKIRTKRERTPELSGFVSIMGRNRSSKQLDLKPSGSCGQLPMKPTAQSTNASIELPPRAAIPPSNHPTTQVQTDAPPTSLSFAPKGPRALGGGSLVCFYWYHKGYCRPKRRNARMTTCTYAHALDVPYPQVSLPPGIDNHDLDCSLPLCPIRLAAKGQDPTNENSTALETIIKDEPFTPPKYGALHMPYSSSPRDGIPEARAHVKGPKFDSRYSSLQLPKLIGANRERFKTQKRAIETWQAKEGIKPYDRNKEIEERKELKKKRKQLKQEKRMSKRQKTRKAALDYGHDTLNDIKLEPAAITIPAKRPSKKSKRIKTKRRAGELFERDAANAGVVETFDSQAEQRKASFQPIAGFPEHRSTRAVKEEMGDGQQHVRTGMGVSDSSEYGLLPGSWGQLSAMRTSTTQDHGDDEPSSEESRLDWDTDEVRALFGRIE
jgi:hypothetical protein